MPGREESSAPVRNNRAGRKKLQDVFRCVTTRGAQRRCPWSRLRWPAAGRPGMPSAGGAGVPPRHVAGVPREQHGISFAAWRRATDLPASDIRARGNSVGCNFVPEIPARSLYRGKSAIPAAAPWHTHRFRCYAELVPWEVMTPLGPPGEDRLVLLGHSALNAFSLSVAIGLQPLATSRGSCPGKRGKTDEMPQTAQAVTCERNREGDAAEMLWA